MADNNGVDVKLLLESETVNIYKITDEEGDIGYDINLFDTITVHFLEEEWEEFVEAIKTVS